MLQWYGTRYFAHYPPGFSSDNCIFLYASFVETPKAGNTNVPPPLRVLEPKTTNEHIHHYNVKYLQYIPVNASYLELCQLTLRSKLGDPLAVAKGLAVMACHFDLFSGMANRKLQLLVLILIVMFLLLDYDNWAMESTITGVILQCPMTVSAIGLLSCLTLLCCLLKYTGCRRFCVLYTIL